MEGTSVFSLCHFSRTGLITVFTFAFINHDMPLKWRSFNNPTFFTFIIPSANPKNRMPNSAWRRARRFNSAWISVMKRARKEESHDEAFYGGEEMRESETRESRGKREKFKEEVWRLNNNPSETFFFYISKRVKMRRQASKHTRSGEHGSSPGPTHPIKPRLALWEVRRWEDLLSFSAITSPHRQRARRQSSP